MKELLQGRFPEWEAGSRLPGRSRQELREWLYQKLTGEPWIPDLSWTEAAAVADPFDPEDIDPAPDGRLSKMISNLQRKRK